jgi:hypothetical protein
MNIKRDSSVKSVILETSTVIHQLNENISIDNHFKMCKEIFSTVPVVFYTKKDFYLLEVLNEKIDILKSNGLIDYWYKQDMKISSFKVSKLIQPKVLTVKNFTGSFFILLIGVFVSFFVLISEILFVILQQKY